MLAGISKRLWVASSTESEDGSLFYRVVVRLLETAAIVLMSALSVLVFVNAMGRYAFTAPLPWTEEVVLNVLVWIAGVGIVLAGIKRSLICCEVIAARVGSGSKRVLAAACGLLGAAVMIYFSWLTLRYLLLFGADRSPILHIPKSVMILGILFATLGLAITLLISVFSRRTGDS
jgi:TRAP-type C4-dicarboxylate transport system permease small subunit